MLCNLCWVLWISPLCWVALSWMSLCWVSWHPKKYYVTLWFLCPGKCFSFQIFFCEKLSSQFTTAFDVWTWTSLSKKFLSLLSIFNNFFYSSSRILFKCLLFVGWILLKTQVINIFVENTTAYYNCKACFILYLMEEHILVL